MEQISEWVSTIRSTIMAKMIKYTDPAYFFLKQEPNTNEDEKKYI
jgi:hypothetical protein